MNYANLDMVGHTGNLQAAIKAAEEYIEALESDTDVDTKREAYRKASEAANAYEEKLRDVKDKVEAKEREVAKAMAEVNDASGKLKAAQEELSGALVSGEGVATKETAFKDRKGEAEGLLSRIKGLPGGLCRDCAAVSLTCIPSSWEAVQSTSQPTASTKVSVAKDALTAQSC